MIWLFILAACIASLLFYAISRAIGVIFGLLLCAATNTLRR